MQELSRWIEALVSYGIRKQLLTEEDRIYTTNRLLAMFKEDEYFAPEEGSAEPCEDLEQILKALLDIAVERGLVQDSGTYRDLFDAELMNLLLPRPSEVSRIFWEKYQSSPKEATDFYYSFSQAGLLLFLQPGL